MSRLAKPSVHREDEKRSKHISRRPQQKPKPAPPNPTSRQKGGHASNGDEAERGTMIPSNPRRGWISAAGRVFTRLDAVAYFTLVLAMFTGVQIWAFVSSERAFISVEPADPRAKISASDNPIVLRVIIRNGGRSTAMTVEYDVDGKLLPGDLPPIPVYVGIHQGVVGPVLPGGFRYATERPLFVDGPGKGKPAVLGSGIVTAINPAYPVDADTR